MTAPLVPAPYPRIEFTDAPGRYLVALDGMWGRILDRPAGKYWPIGRTVSMLVQGQWLAYDGPQEQLAAWIAACEDVEATLEPWQRWPGSPGWAPMGAGHGDNA